MHCFMWPNALLYASVLSFICSFAVSNSIENDLNLVVKFRQHCTIREI